MPTKKPRTRSEAAPWFVRWPAIYSILHEMDYLFHDKMSPPLDASGVKLLNWLSQ